MKANSLINTYLRVIICIVMITSFIFGQSGTFDEVKSNSYKPKTTGDWEIYWNPSDRENLYIREPEQSNKVWAKFVDDQALHLIGTPNLWVDGNVGIGTSSPNSPFHIKKTSAYFPLRIETTGASSSYMVRLQNNDASSSNMPYWGLFHLDDGKFGIGADYNNLDFTVNTSGNIGIGTTTVPSGYKLAVDGKIISEEVRVELSQNWPDDVFEDGYNLMSIEEVAIYINSNGHLPGIPSEKEVMQNGVSLGEM